MVVYIWGQFLLFLDGSRVGELEKGWRKHVEKMKPTSIKTFSIMTGGSNK